VRILIVFSCSLLICFGVATNSYALNYGNLIGEWSNLGKCDSTRFVFMSDGKYTWLERDATREWKRKFEGIFIPLDEVKLKENKILKNGAIVIAEGKDQGGYLLQIQLMSKTRLKGFWDTERSDGLSFDNPRDALFDYVPCKAR
jgi:hypothetical protein